MGELAIIAGLIALAVGYLGLSRRKGWTRLDPLGMHALLDKPWIGGGRDRYYRQVGWLLIAIGLLSLALELRRGTP
jgi:hypothetical protein